MGFFIASSLYNLWEEVNYCMSKKTKDKLIDSTLTLIDEKPFYQVTTKQIAKRSGLAEVTLFRHFSSKESIINILADQFFKMIIGFKIRDIKSEDDFRCELIKYFHRAVRSDPFQRKMFKVFLYIGMYKKKTFFKYAKIYEKDIVGPIETMVRYGIDHWGYRKNINVDISVKLLINSIGFFNIIQNVFLLREIDEYDFDSIIEIGVDNFLTSLR